MQRKKEVKKKKMFNRSKIKIAIVASLFNEDITRKMQKGALLCLIENKVKKENIEIFYVAGSFELPLICQKLAETKKYDALIAIGCVIKGDTDHYFYIAGESSRALMDVTLKFGIPVGFGIITTNNLRQAKERSGEKNNKGYEAAEAVLRSVTTIESIE